MIKQAASIVLVGLGLTFSAAAQAPTTKRTELARGDLTGTNMEIIVSVVEYPPGDTSVLHTHPGEEAFYVLEGATLETPDGKQLTPVPGVSRINVRDVPHGAFKVIGDKAFKLLAVHIVDKGKTAFVPVKP